MSPKNKSQGGVFQFLFGFFLLPFVNKEIIEEKKHGWHVLITV